MKNVLQLLTGTETKLAQEAAQELKAEVVDLTGENVDYREALEKIFSADSIQVW